MGAKGSKEFDKEKALAELKRSGMSLSKEELVNCVASLSDIAHTGLDLPVSDMPNTSRQHSMLTEDVPPWMRSKVTQDMPKEDIPKETRRKVKHELRTRLKHQLSTNDEQAVTEHVQSQLQLLEGLEDKDESGDWASMRSWMVWCIQNSLDDTDADTDPCSVTPSPLRQPGPKRNQSLPQLQRQMSFDQSRPSFKRQGSSQGSSQGSFESNRSDGSDHQSREQRQMSFDRSRPSFKRQGSSSFESYKSDQSDYQEKLLQSATTSRALKTSPGRINQTKKKKVPTATLR